MAGSSRDSDGQLGAAYLREQLEDQIPPDRDVLAQAGLLDQEVIEFLAFLERHYERPDDRPNAPYYAEDTERYQHISTRNASKNLREAIQNGQTAKIHHFLGLVQQETEISGIKVYERFSRWVTREAGVTYLAGHMGSGKTDLSLTMAETFVRRLSDPDDTDADGEGGDAVHVASNITSCPETETITSHPDLVEWLEETDGRKLFILDDGSDSISGYTGDNQQFIAHFKTLVTFLRKDDAALIVIGHTGKDIHPHIRRLCDYVEKDGYKDAAVFEDVDEGEGQDKKFELSKIPPTSWSYDTKEESPWEWATDEDEGPDLVTIACRVYIDTDLTQQEVADTFETISSSQISKHWKDVRDEEYSTAPA